MAERAKPSHVSEEGGREGMHLQLCTYLGMQIEYSVTVQDKARFGREGSHLI